MTIQPRGIRNHNPDNLRRRVGTTPKTVPQQPLRPNENSGLSCGCR